MARGRPRAHWGGAVRALLMAGTLLVLLAAGSAAGTARHAVTPSGPARVLHTYPITLITGDRVVLTQLSNGKQSVSVAAPRAGGAQTATTPSYHALRQNGDV